MVGNQPIQRWGRIVGLDGGEAWGKNGRKLVVGRQGLVPLNVCLQGEADVLPDGLAVCAQGARDGAVRIAAMPAINDFKDLNQGYVPPGHSRLRVG
ncbi:hypothetical protein D3C72_1663750 [compost metagenome]